MQRFVAGRGGALRYQLPAGTSAATVTVTRNDGTVLVNAQAATNAGSGLFTYPLSIVHTVVTDLLQVAWTTNTGEIYSDRAEIAGGVYFTIAELRASSSKLTADKYPDDLVEAARVAAEAAIEDACGVPFVPRYFSQTGYNTRRSTSLGGLPPFVRSLRSATADGVAVDVSSAVLTNDDEFYLAGYWPTGTLVLHGEYGYDFVPPRVARAAVMLAGAYLFSPNSAISDRTMRHTNQHGETEIFVVAGRGGALFDIPEVNAVVELYGITRGAMVA